MILYMEQYILSYYSQGGDPALVPSCQRPNTSSCDWMRCSWNSSIVVANHSYQFLRCAKPQAVRVIMSSEQGVFDRTLAQSTVMKLDQDYSLNITIKHAQPQYFGLQVRSMSYITRF